MTNRKMGNIGLRVGTMCILSVLSKILYEYGPGVGILKSQSTRVHYNYKDLLSKNNTRLDKSHNGVLWGF